MGSFNFLLIDLDDTLYPHSTGMWQVIRARMELYMRDYLHIPEEDIGPMRDRYYAEYGTTLRGLQNDRRVNSDEFLDFVHDVQVARYVTPNVYLKGILESVPQPIWIFTNADAAHAERVLAALDIRDCFSGIIDVRALDFIPKPDPAAFQKALQIAGAARPQECIFFDDAPRNLRAARNLGFFTVQVQSDEQPELAGDRMIESWQDLPQVVPEIWV
ncbi:MAG: pyrimidine 5'-nucleotidase [Anaerolineales bacterium]|nr:pyrimidine 5'-nucleotidase [Anaerolineales bacterium]